MTSVKDELDPDLVREYEHAIFEITFPDGVVTLSRYERPVPDSRRLRGQAVTIVTAFNPLNEHPGESANRAANAELRAHIEREGWEFFEAIGGNVQRTYQEPSFVVMGLGPTEARELGEQYRQACVFHWDGQAGDLLWCQRTPE